MTTAQMSLICQIITSTHSSVHLKTFIWAIRKMTQISTELYKLVISLTTPRVMRINSVLLEWFYQLVALTLQDRNSHWIGSALGQGRWELESARWGGPCVQSGEAESKRESQLLPESFLTLAIETTGRLCPFNLRSFVLTSDSRTPFLTDQRSVPHKIPDRRLLDSECSS